MNTLEQLKKEMDSLATPERAAASKRFFKTGKGQYAEGDEFIGINLPDQRKVAKRYSTELRLDDLETLLQSKVHEHRLTALIMMVLQFNKAKNAETKKTIIDVYLANLAGVNNWNLVDTSAYSLLGAYLLDQPKTLLYDLANSGDLWKQRIAIIATLHFIKQNRFNDTLAIAEILLQHPHDLIHKATGWMLREVGERNLDVELNFLKQHYRKMPRTMLRYAIEKLEPQLKNSFMKGSIN